MVCTFDLLTCSHLMSIFATVWCYDSIVHYPLHCSRVSQKSTGSVLKDATAPSTHFLRAVWQFNRKFRSPLAREM